MIPHEQAVIADTIQAHVPKLSRDIAVAMAGEIIEALRKEGYDINERRPGA